MREVLENMDGYVVSLTPFYLMEESDWVVLRLLVDVPKFTDECRKAMKFLMDKYGVGVVRECHAMLIEEKPNA